MTKYYSALSLTIGEAQKIADTSEISLNMTQQQLKRFESSGLISSVKKGNTRIYLWNPRYPFRAESTCRISFICHVLVLSRERERGRERERERERTET